MIAWNSVSGFVEERTSTCASGVVLVGNNKQQKLPHCV